AVTYLVSFYEHGRIIPTSAVRRAICPSRCGNSSLIAARRRLRLAPVAVGLRVGSLSGKSKPPPAPAQALPRRGQARTGMFVVLTLFAHERPSARATVAQTFSSDTS